MILTHLSLRDQLDISNLKTSHAGEVLLQREITNPTISLIVPSTRSVAGGPLHPHQPGRGGAGGGLAVGHAGHITLNCVITLV